MPLAQELPTSQVFDATLWLAQELKAQVQAAYIRPNPDAAASMVPEMIAAAGVTREAIEREGRQAASAAEARFAEWRDRNGGSAKVAEGKAGGWAANWSEHVGEFEPVVTRYGRLSDFIILPRPAGDEIVAQRCFDAAVFGTGRPSLLVGDTLPANLTDNILIAWNGSLEASRAVFGAMPLLRLAKRVTIFTALEYGAEAVDLDDLAVSLRARGIHTPEVIFPTGERATGTALVMAAQTHQATLIVMGAYTHSRMREAFLGGVTKQLLADAPVPLLMSH
ncbi:MAG TPA: universal stress protein [Stellaceae bacterium]|nr:universal stress protein [Stellaceae bacterium]